jgi:alpha-glucosidase (family GH31 glycosyl hydrolase)
VPIVDAGVAKESDAYEIGSKLDIFIKDLRGKEYKGLVWPGDTAFVDYFHPNAIDYWINML